MKLRSKSAACMAALMAGSGVLHFLQTDAYARIVPHFLPDPRAVVQVSGVAEMICGAMVAFPKTRRIGGLCTAALLIAVFPANIQMALDGGYKGAAFPFNSVGLAWLRLPLQFPLIA